MTLTLATTDAQNACDNLGKAMIDAVTAAVPSSANITAVLTTDLGTEVTRILALGDSQVVAILDAAWKTEQRQTALNANLPAGKMGALLALLTYTYLLQNGFYYACDALDFVASQTSGNYTGLANYLSANSMMVDQYTADAFNQWCSAVASGAYIRVVGTNTSPAKIASVNVFPHSNVDTINQLTTTSATAGNLVAGTQTLAGAQIAGGNTAPGIGTLEAYAGNTIGASTWTLTVTYTKIDGTTTTNNYTITCNATSGTVFTGTAVQAQNIVSVSFTGANTGDVVKFRLKPVRTIAA